MKVCSHFSRLHWIRNLRESLKILSGNLNSKSFTRTSNKSLNTLKYLESFFSANWMLAWYPFPGSISRYAFHSIKSFSHRELFKHKNTNLCKSKNILFLPIKLIANLTANQSIAQSTCTSLIESAFPLNYSKSILSFWWSLYISNISAASS